MITIYDPFEDTVFWPFMDGVTRRFRGRYYDPDKYDLVPKREYINDEIEKLKKSKDSKLEEVKAIEDNIAKLQKQLK